MAVTWWIVTFSHCDCQILADPNNIKSSISLVLLKMFPQHITEVTGALTNILVFEWRHWRLAELWHIILLQVDEKHKIIASQVYFHKV